MAVDSKTSHSWKKGTKKGFSSTNEAIQLEIRAEQGKFRLIYRIFMEMIFGVGAGLKMSPPSLSIHHSHVFVTENV